MALITWERAAELIPNFDTNDEGVLTDIVNAASCVVERFCSRTFALTSYDELYDGNGTRSLFLNNFPISYINRIMYNPIQVFMIQMTDQGTSRATWRLDQTNLYLSSVKSGIETDYTIARSSCLMLSDLQNAVNVYSSTGWLATAMGIYATWPVAELYYPQGGLDSRWQGASYLKHHAYNFAAYDYNPDTGEISSPYGFQWGYRNYRVISSAGFTTIPDAIQQATAELAVAAYNTRGLNANLQSESLGQYSYSQLAEKSFANLSSTAKAALYSYKSYRISRYKTEL